MKETKSTPAAGIRELVTAVKAQMSGLGYSQYTIDRMDAVWKNLASYCEEHNDGLLTAESARGFVWDLYGAVLGEKDASQNVNRAVHILLDFQQFGMIFKQSHMTLKSFSDAFSPLFEGFLEKQRKDGFAEGSVRTWRSRLFRFEYFLANSGIDRFSQIELHHLNAYIETLAGFSSGTVGGTIKLLGRLSEGAFPAPCRMCAAHTATGCRQCLPRRKWSGYWHPLTATMPRGSATMRCSCSLPAWACVSAMSASSALIPSTGRTGGYPLPRKRPACRWSFRSPTMQGGPLSTILSMDARKRTAGTFSCGTQPHLMP